MKDPFKETIQSYMTNSEVKEVVDQMRAALLKAYMDAEDKVIMEGIGTPMGAWNQEREYKITFNGFGFDSNYEVFIGYISSHELNVLTYYGFTDKQELVFAILPTMPRKLKKKLLHLANNNIIKLK